LASDRHAGCLWARFAGFMVLAALILLALVVLDGYS
jgi:hypothetical protein